MSGRVKEPITTAMILAAGLGSRLRPLTDNTPKPLINVGGQPVILRAMQSLKLAGITKVVINTHYLATLVEQTVRANNQGLTVYFSREETLLETGGGIKKALPLLGKNPFVVVNSDAVWREGEVPLLRPLLKAFDQRKHDALLAVVETASTKSFRDEGGDFVFDAKTKLLSRPKDFGKNRKKCNMVFTGIHVTHPDFIAFEKDEKFSLIRPWNAAMAEGRLHGFAYDAPWVDMGTHTGLQVARELVSRQKA